MSSTTIDGSSPTAGGAGGGEGAAVPGGQERGASARTRGRRSGAARHGPRERLLVHGEARLSDAECVGLVLRTGRRGTSAEALAVELLDAYGGLDALAAAEVREVASHPGVGLVRAGALHAAFGLARRLIVAALRPGEGVRCGGDAARLVRESARREGKESLFALLLDTRHRLLSFRVVSVGGLDGAPVHPREVFRPAIREGAAAIVLAHNHPSGDATPSATDRLVTDRLRQVGRLVGIEVLDHVVVGSDRYYSFAEENAFSIP